MVDEKDVEGLIRSARKLCHDMNQPLTVIMARSELVMFKMAPDNPNYKSIEQIRDQAEKLTQLVEDMRELMKGFQEE